MQLKVKEIEATVTFKAQLHELCLARHLPFPGGPLNDFTPWAILNGHNTEVHSSVLDDMHVTKPGQAIS